MNGTDRLADTRPELCDVDIRKILCSFPGVWADRLIARIACYYVRCVIYMKAERAKIFAPYDALKGLYSELQKKEKIVIPKKELSEDQLELLNRFFSELRPGDYIYVTYYDRDSYRYADGTVNGFTPDKKAILLASGSLFEGASDYDCGDTAILTIPFTDISEASF